MKGSFLFSFRFKRNLPAPVAVDKSTVFKQVLIIHASDSGNRTYKTGIEKKDEIIVDIQMLVHLAGILGYRFIFNATNFKSFNYFTVYRRIFGTVYFRYGFCDQQREVVLVKN